MHQSDAGLSTVRLRAVHGALLGVLTLALVLLAPRLAAALGLNIASLMAIGVSMPAPLRDLSAGAIAAAPDAAGRIAFAQGDNGGAIAHFSRALASGHERDVTRFQLGLALARANRQDEALAQWRAADAAPCFLLRGLALRHRRDWSGAAEAFAIALAIEPANPRLHAVTGRFYREWEKPAEARTFLGSALALEARPLERLMLQGELAHLEGRIKDARASFAAAVRMQPAYPDAYVRLADAHFALAQPADAVDTLRAALRDAAPSIAVHARLAEWFTAQGDFAAADQLLQAAQRIDPRSDEPWLLRARNALAWQRPDVAAEYLQRALQLEPDNAETHYWLAQTKSQLGR